MSYDQRLADAEREAAVALRERDELAREIGRLRAEPLYQTLDELRKERIVIAAFLDGLAGRLMGDMWTCTMIDEAAAECRELARRLLEPVAVQPKEPPRKEHDDEYHHRAPDQPLD